MHIRGYLECWQVAKANELPPQRSISVSVNFDQGIFKFAACAPDWPSDHCMLVADATSECFVFLEIQKNIYGDF